jgi:hypothetical protein
MFNSCNKYGELYCWPFVDIIYFAVILMNKHKFFKKKKKRKKSHIKNNIYTLDDFFLIDNKRIQESTNMSFTINALHFKLFHVEI